MGKTARTKAKTTADEISSVELPFFHPAVRAWFTSVFAEPTRAQSEAWPSIARGDHTLLLAPTGSGKTLAAFLVAIDRVLFEGTSSDHSVATKALTTTGAKTGRGTRVLYISPLKALGVDVERNLRAPIAGVRAAAERLGYEYHEPRIGVRSGDTSSRERAELVRNPPDILITTPESLFLLLTSRARDTLLSVETVIIDEIHSLVASKRGAHLFLSLERLEQLRARAMEAGRVAVRPLQRIGLSATQRPLHEIARLLGGGVWCTTDVREERLEPRQVTLVEAGRSRPLDLRIEVPVEDLTNLAAAGGGREAAGEGPTAIGIPSIWPAIQPRLVELIRAHRSTMIFVNSRRLAERLALAINDLAEEEIALAHHGSIAKATRRDIEDRLKLGKLPAIVATSSLELGIDMGAVDLVIQIEAPPTIASGIQRVGRSGHQVGARSTGILFPKYRGDLLSCAAATQRMLAGEVEETCYPRNPLDVLAQQIVAMVAQDPWQVDDLYQVIRQAAPFHELPRSAFEGVLDLLSGRYPSDEFSELRPRLHWDRVAGTLVGRKNAQRLAILNAGTIPDRGLYGVFLAGNEATASRVGELDEEMVFEMHAGDIFQLGASSWRVAEITHDRVLVTPAAGEPGRMPFWHGDGPGRPAEFGRAIGRLTRELSKVTDRTAMQRLQRDHGLDERAARNLLQYLRQQAGVTGEVPSDETLVVESFLDEAGDWRVTILSPFGARLHAPWAMAVMPRLRELAGDEVDMMWTDDGIVFRLPEVSSVPDVSVFFPTADEIEELVVQQLGGTALFAGRFRENAARALLLPRRSIQRRTPLWLQRRKAADLLAVAASYPSFPLIMETYRECLRDIFDVPGLRQLLRDVEQGSLRVHQVETEQPSPFSSTLLFNYTGNFVYQGDAPLAERRAQALSLDHAQLNELLGAVELRELMHQAAIDELGDELQRLTPRLQIRDADHLHDTLRVIGDLSDVELRLRVATETTSDQLLATWLDELQSQRRIVATRIAGELRWIAVEDAARYRDALGVPLPVGLPEVFLAAVPDALEGLVLRYARTHLPFRVEEIAARWGLGVATVRLVLDRLVQSSRLLVGEFRPGNAGQEWTEPQVLRAMKRRSLARWRQQIEPVEPQALARFLPAWQSITMPRRGLDGVLDTIQQMQGVVLPCSVWERDVLPLRIRDFQVAQLDELCVAGEICWRGFESLGNDDGRISLYLHDHLATLAPPATTVDDPLAARIVEALQSRGALFFDELARALGDFPPDIQKALWELVWAGQVTNDSLVPLRARRRNHRPSREVRRGPSNRFRSRRTTTPADAQGRWTLLDRVGQITPSRSAGPNSQGEATTMPAATTRLYAMAMQLIDRYGVLTRELAAYEMHQGGFSSIYPVLKALEEAGKLRRGYFVAGRGATQFAAPGAEDRLRHLAQPDRPMTNDVWVMAATDPANPYGSAIAWPTPTGDGLRPQRAAGARVIIFDGELIGYLGRTSRDLLTWLTVDGYEQSSRVAALAQGLIQAAQRESLLLQRIDRVSALESPLRRQLQEHGFIAIARGLLRRPAPAVVF